MGPKIFLISNDFCGKMENQNIEGSEGQKFFLDDQNVESQKDQNVESFIRTSKITLSKRTLKVRESKIRTSKVFQKKEDF
jgi:hypothetical protein